METQTPIPDMKEVLRKLSNLQEDVNHLMETQDMKSENINVIEESLKEIWDNEEDERWNEC